MDSGEDGHEMTRAGKVFPTVKTGDRKESVAAWSLKGDGARMIRRIPRNLSLFRIGIKHLLFAILRIFSYTLGFLLRYPNKALRCFPGSGSQPDGKLPHAKLRTIANDSKSGQEREPEMSTSFLCSNRPSDGR